MEKLFIEELKSIYPINLENDKKLIEKFPLINWGDVLLTWKKNCLLNRFLSISKNFEISNFLEGVQYEYGLNNYKIDVNKAFNIYKLAADTTTDCLSMYKMYTIYFREYKKFNIARDKILEKFYLFKCLAYSPHCVYSRNIELYSKVDLIYEIAYHLDIEDNNLEKINKLLDYLLEINDKFKNSQNKEILLYKFPPSQISLIKGVILHKYPKDDNDKIKSLEILSQLILFAHDEAIYKLGCLEIKKDLKLAKSFFEKLEENKYYRAYDEYGKLLYTYFNEDEKALKIFQEGMKNGNFYCYIYYYDLKLYLIKKEEYYENKENLGKKLFKLLDIILNDILCGGVFSFFEYFYLRLFLIKHFNLKKQIDEKYGEITKELINFLLNITKPEQKNLLNNNFNNDYAEAEFCFSLGILYYYGVDNLIQKDYKKSYELINRCYNFHNSKSYKRFIYSYIFKIYKHNKDKNLKLPKIDEIKKNIFDLYYSSLSEQKIQQLSSSYFYYLAKLYELGIGTEKNYLMAYAYYLQASKKEPKSLGKGSIISYKRNWKTKEILKKKIFVDVEYSLDNLVDDDLGVGIEGNLCCICYQNERNHIILPCKHKFCENCVNLLEEKCPLCRGKIIIHKKLNKK